MVNKEEVELGDEVIDVVSGLKGIAVVRYQFLQGCDRICIQPACGKDNSYPSSQVFDEPQLKVSKKQKVKPEHVSIKERPGGEDKYPIQNKNH